MSFTDNWPKDRVGVARYAYSLPQQTDRTLLIEWIPSLDTNFGLFINRVGGKTYLKAHDITVQVDESPAVIELLRLWAVNELSPTPRKSLIRIDPDADQDRVRKIQKKIQGLTGDPDAHPAAESPTADEALTNKDRKILLDMLKHGHFDDGQGDVNAIKGKAIARRLNIGDDKHMMDNLKALGLVKRRQNKGSWLTEMGLQMAKHIQQMEGKTD